MCMLVDKFKVLLIYPNCMMMNLLPSSIASLSAYLKHNGVDVELFDTTFYQTEEESFDDKKVKLLQVKPFDMGVEIKPEQEMYNDLNIMVNDYKPDLIGISLVEDTIPLGLKLLRFIREYDCPVIAGGVGVTFNQELIWEEDIDILCIGEGEEALLQAIRNIQSGHTVCGNINNLYWKTKYGNGLQDNYSTGGINPPIDINKLPFLDFDIFGEDRLKRPMHGEVKRMIHVEVDRGCPYSCSYCAASKLKKMYGGKYYRRKTTDRVIAELSYLKGKYNPDYVDINSETFLARPYDDLKGLLNRYSKDVDTPYWCQGRPETFTEDKVKLLKATGCSDTQMGIEQGNEEFRKKYLHRNMSNSTILNSCLLLEEYGLPYSVNNIIGWPDETRALIFETTNLNRLINPKTHNCYIMTPYRGSWIYDYCIKEGLLEEGSKTGQALIGSDIKYRYTTKEELLGIQRCFSLYAKMRHVLPSTIERAEKFDDYGNKLFAELSKEYREKYYAK